MAIELLHLQDVGAPPSLARCSASVRFADLSGGVMKTDSTPMAVVHEIELLFGVHSGRSYEGLRRESVSALEHALQCA